MLTPKEIQTALHANRVVPVAVSNPHGPLGLELLAEEVSRLRETRPSQTNAVQRPISLPLETWEKLNGIARELCQKSSTHVTASDVATSLVMQFVNSVGNQ